MRIHSYEMPRALSLLLLAAAGVYAQDAPPDAANPPAAAPERWNIFWQATSIGQAHDNFHAPYTGPESLSGPAEAEASLTTTLFTGFRLAQYTELYFDPEIAGGKGFSNVDGLANASNGELPRVSSATPKPYLARLYLAQDFGFGDEKEDVESDTNQLGGARPMTRYSIYAGRFTVTDFFDKNSYSNDPRTQFMGWAVMFNGAWDYPADTRGYTWGWVHEFHTRNWSVRYASAAEPKVANGEQFDRRLFRDRGDMFEGERRYAPHKHPGVARLLAFLLHTDSGSYGEALQLAAKNGTTPDINDTLQVGRLKYGVGLNMEQEIAKDVGVFGRLGWNDGKTESFAFTAIDRLATGGVSFNGSRWGRPNDTMATELTVSGLSAVHADYLAHGGLDFLIGDGRLRYGPETIWETYYSARIREGLFTSLDAQYAVNPAYNRDRGPVWIGSLRLHVELGKKTFTRQP
ncbi:MAG TPA: carbohydrate porin [Bryobacteraceae bacterium]|jgi:high affinity Mn2+ porin